MRMMQNHKSNGQIKGIKKQKQRTLIRIIVLEVSRVLEPSKLLFISVSPPKKKKNASLSLLR